jgi:hypothetical protein
MLFCLDSVHYSLSLIVCKIQGQSDMDLDEAANRVVKVRRHKIKIDVDYFIRSANSRDAAMGGHASGIIAKNTIHHQELDVRTVSSWSNGMAEN